VPSQHKLRPRSVRIPAGASARLAAEAARSGKSVHGIILDAIDRHQRDISDLCERDLCDRCRSCDCGCHERRWAELP
jgi:hypothetical protein